jgi:polar amino acid transport system substrate-binding protein
LISDRDNQKLTSSLLGSDASFAPKSEVELSLELPIGTCRHPRGTGSDHAVEEGASVLAIKDPKSGEVRGPALDLARVLATKIGVQIEPVEYPRPGAILQGIQNNEWDVTFLVADPARLAEADFSPPYMQTEYTYLVPAGSSKHSVADIDEPGVRIAVPRGDGSDLRLTQTLKHAELVRADSVAAIIDMVRAGQVDAYAGPRVVLLKLSDQAPGSRVLDDGFADIVYIAMVPKGRAGRIAYMSDFIEEAKSSGLVQRTIDRYGLKGIKVAGAKSPADDSSR